MAFKITDLPEDTALADGSQIEVASISGSSFTSKRALLSTVVAFVLAKLATFSTSTRGLVPQSPGGTTAFLRADGTFAAPPVGGSGTVTNVSATGSNGVTVSVANSTTTPTISIGLGAITPTSIGVSGQIVTQGAATATFAGNGSILAGGTDTGSTKGPLVGVNIPYAPGAFGGLVVGYANQANPKWLIGVSRGASDENALTFFEDSSSAKVRFALKPGGVISSPSLPTYATDAAAATGGLAKGDWYQTSTGELRIKL